MNDIAPISVSDLELDEVLLPRRQGLERPLSWFVVRVLEPADLPDLMKAGALSPVGAMKPIGAIRTQHHLIAQLMAEGKSNIEIGLISGYTPQHISNMRADPAFKELLAHYMAMREKVFVDVLERMKTLGVMSLDELQQRMVDEPEKFKSRELMEMVQLLLKEGPGARGSGAAAGVAISVNFVPSDGVGGTSVSPKMEMKDITPGREDVA